MEADVLLLLAFFGVLIAFAPAVALYLVWGVIKTLRVVAYDANERASQVQARWLSRELAGSSPELAGMALDQARETKQPVTLPQGSQPNWDELQTLVQ